jgi:hypothetical protein
MAITVVPIFLLPTMDSERFERCSFSLNDAESLLTISMTDLPPYIIHFHRLTWHRFTSHADCGPGLTMGCEMAVAEVAGSPALKAYIQKASLSPEEAAQLRHYRIYLGKGGCHEAFAQSVYGSGAGKFSLRMASFVNDVKLRFRR